MKKYRNISGQRLHLDCITHTIHMEPDWVMFLPVSRDVRHNAQTGNLSIIRERGEKKPRKRKKKFSPAKVSKKKKWKAKKENKEIDSNLEKMETK